MGVILAIITLIDGVSTRNPAGWAEPIRAGLLCFMLAVGLVMLRRARVTLDPVHAALVGALSAMCVSDAYHHPGIGLWLMLVYAGWSAVAGLVKLDWRRDIAVCGAIIAAVFAVSVLAAGYPPDGSWNKNVIAGVLLVTLPASTQLQGRARVVTLVAILAGLAVSQSRGALGGAFVALSVLYQPLALAAAPVLAAGLIALRGFQSVVRLSYWQSGIDAMLESALGVGPGNLALPSFDSRPGPEIHAHNSLLTFSAQVGLIGVVVAALVPISVWRKVRLERWQLATLAGVAVQALVDDPLAWMPVGVMLVLALSVRSASQSSDALDLKSV